MKEQADTVPLDGRDRDVPIFILKSCQDGLGKFGAFAFERDLFDKFRVSKGRRR